MFTGTLHPYQQPAVDLILRENKALIAFEMGLGKTPLTIAAIEQLADEGQVDTGLVIGLSGLKYQWRGAIDRFTCDSCMGKLDVGEDGHEHTPTATALVIDGTKAQREAQYAAAMTGQYRYVILNYEAVVNDWNHVRRLPRDFVIADEVTAIKSFKSQRARRVKRLQAPYIVGLTGTPIENKLEELFSIMQFINDKVLGRFDLFDRVFLVRNQWGGLQRVRQVPLFRKTMESAWIVKTQKDDDVAAYMPKVVEQTHLVPMDKQTAKLYNLVAQELIADLGDALSQGMSGFDLAAHYGGGGDDAVDPLRGAIASKTMCLQMLCDHPALVKHSALRWAEQLKTGKGTGSEYAWQLDQAGLLPDSLVKKKPPKMEDALALIEGALERPENKVVLFCHDVPMLPILQAALPAGIAVTYDGTMNAQEKEVAKQSFMRDEKVRVFLSSDAGGFGLDLFAGSVLLHYDEPWSAGALAQRSSRIIRASSKHERVFIHTLLVEKTVDVWTHSKVAGKVALADAFVRGVGLDAKGGLDMTAEGLMNFLLANLP